MDRSMVRLGRSMARMPTFTLSPRPTLAPLRTLTSRPVRSFTVQRSGLSRAEGSALKRTSPSARYLRMLTHTPCGDMPVTTASSSSLM